MAIDGIILHSLCNELKGHIPCKINKIQQVSDTEILFTIRSQSGNQKLMISTHSNYNRIHFTNKAYDTPDYPSAFLMLLRKYINGAIIRSMKQDELDRIVHFTIETRDDLGDMQSITMVVELMGKYANIILVNAQNKIIDALKRIPPFENSVRTIHPGADFIPVAAHHEKLNPFTLQKVDIEQSLTKQLQGFSPLLAKEVVYRIQTGESFESIMQAIQTSSQIYFYDDSKKDEFHLIELKHLHMHATISSIQEAMDSMYTDKEERVRIKEQSGDLFKIARQELKKNQNKLKKLNSTLEDANQLETYQQYGDLLYAYAYQVQGRSTQVTLPSFEDGSDIMIPLDEKLDVKQNAKKYYQKYTKSKTAQIEVAKQIAITQQWITYFESLLVQLEYVQVSDALEIREELTQLNFVKRRQQRQRRKKKKQVPNFIHLRVDQIDIYVGKNNIQNDYITFKQARKHHLWFHAKDIHGSHVVVASEVADEKLMRIAAMFAAYYSNGRLSSSVPVNYCFVKQLRKPNQAALGLVTLTNYKTMYIDPDKQMIQSYLQEYSI